MFAKLSIFVSVITVATAFTVSPLTDATSGGETSISWTTSAGDPSTFSIELVNVDNFHNSFALANNVDPTTSPLNLTLPVVPVGSGYTLELVDISNITDVFATSSSFSIGATVSSTSSTSSTTLSSVSASSGSVSGSVSGSGSVATTKVATSTSGFGVTVSASSTAPASTGTSASGTSSAAQSSGSAFNNAAFSAKVLGFPAITMGAVAAMFAGALIL